MSARIGFQRNLGIFACFDWCRYNDIFGFRREIGRSTGKGSTNDEDHNCENVYQPKPEGFAGWPVARVLTKYSIGKVTEIVFQDISQERGEQTANSNDNPKNPSDFGRDSWQIVVLLYIP